MKLFTVKLTDDERAKLEAYRASRGLRSQAEAVRHMIAESCPPAPNPRDYDPQEHRYPAEAQGTKVHHIGTVGPSVQIGPALGVRPIGYVVGEDGCILEPSGPFPGPMGRPGVQGPVNDGVRGGPPGAVGDLQIGPAPVAPGSRLKQPKGKK